MVCTESSFVGVQAGPLPSPAWKFRKQKQQPLASHIPGALASGGLACRRCPLTHLALPKPCTMSQGPRKAFCRLRKAFKRYLQFLPEAGSNIKQPPGASRRLLGSRGCCAQSAWPLSEPQKMGSGGAGQGRVGLKPARPVIPLGPALWGLPHQCRKQIAFLGQLGSLWAVGWWGEQNSFTWGPPPAPASKRFKMGLLAAAGSDVIMSLPITSRCLVQQHEHGKWGPPRGGGGAPRECPALGPTTPRASPCGGTQKVTLWRLGPRGPLDNFPPNQECLWCELCQNYHPSPLESRVSGLLGGREGFLGLLEILGEFQPRFSRYTTISYIGVEKGGHGGERGEA